MVATLDFRYNMFMQQFTQKYTIAQLLEDTPEGSTYSYQDWPLHVTIADVFAIDWSVTMLIEELYRLLATYKPVSAIAADDAYFGAEKDIQVVLLDTSNEVIALHYNIVALLEHGNVRFNNPQFTRSGFVAHSTVRPRSAP